MQAHDQRGRAATGTGPANRLCVVYSPARHRQAGDFAASHGLPLFTATQENFALQLRFLDERIELFDSELGTAIHVDFLGGTLAHRERFGGGKGQAIARAIGLNRHPGPAVIDATAGLARDAYVLATLGCRLTLVERSPVLVMMVDDAIRRALAADAHHPAGNITGLVNADSTAYLAAMDTGPSPGPDVVYLDPMYPPGKKAALVKKDMQILHRLIGAGEDEAGLLAAALERARRRVVVKRPSGTDPLPGPVPTTAIAAKKTRFDIYITC